MLVLTVTTVVLRALGVDSDRVGVVGISASISMLYHMAELRAV